MPATATPITDELRKQHTTLRSEAAEKWQAWETFKNAHTPEQLAGEKFEEAEACHKAYAEVADALKQTEARLHAAIAMETGGEPSLKDIGEDGSEGRGGFSRKDGQNLLIKTMSAMLGEAADTVLDDPSYKAYVENKGAQSTQVQVGSLFTVVDAIKRAEFKTLVTGAGATHGDVLVLEDRQPGLVEGFDRVLNSVTPLVTSSTTDSDTVEWVEMDAVTNNAAETPEAVDADKAAGAAASTAPESAFTLVLRSTPVQEIKHFIPETKRAAADAGQLRTIIDSELMQGIRDRLDGQLLNGDGIAPNLKGILNTSGIQTQALGGDTRPDAVHKAITKLLISNFGSLVILMNANDWQTIRLQKNANGDYQMGPPNMVGARQLWGYPVVLSQRLSAGTALVGDFSRAFLWIREGISISATDSHSDWFLKGIIAVLAGFRAAFGVKQPRAFCTVTGI